jgi:DNA-binding LacI/PurR family transcriptional regulator
VRVRRGYVRYGGHDRNVARRLAAKLLAQRDRPTAVFASSDVQALGVIGAARDIGLGVPGDLSVVGFDDIEISGYAGLTTVRQPLYESGRLGARVLLEALDGGGSPMPVRHELPLELVVRSTTSAPRTGEGPPERRRAEEHG